MSELKTEQEEFQWFQHIKETLEHQIALRQDKRAEVSDELRELNEIIAKSRGDMDGVERMALRQIASMEDVRKRSTEEIILMLQRMLRSPYFGRIDFVSDTNGKRRNIYIGVNGLQKPGEGILIYDWRAPISSLFYDYEVGHARYDAPSGAISGQIDLKRQYKIEEGELRFILDSSVAITDTMLLDTLAQNASTHMRQIASTIQKEQNRIIRDEKHRALIVQGIAGSGKTSVALHRVAYLLFRKRDSVSSQNMIIFSPNRIFADYISSVLPELGEENIMQLTYDDCIRGMLGSKLNVETRYEQLEYLCTADTNQAYQDRSASIRFKASEQFSDVLVSYAQQVRKQAWQFSDITRFTRVVVPAAHLRQIYRDYCAGLPVRDAAKKLTEMAVVKYAEAMPQADIRKQIASMVKKPNPIIQYYALFSSAEALQKACEGKLSTEEAQQICNATKRRKGDRAVLYEDAAPLLLFMGYLEGFREDASIAHIVVDEAQDYTPIQFEILRTLFSNSDWTILGDTNQLVNPCLKSGDFTHIEKVFKGLKPVTLRLHTSYRSSHELTEFTRYMSNIPDATYATAREGKKPVVSIHASNEALTQQVARDISRLQSQGCASVAVICKSAAEAQMAYQKLEPLCEISLVTSQDTTLGVGALVLPVYLAKGLEFDGVILYDAGSANYSQPSERELLYTACTRALHQLSIHCLQQPSPLLPLDNTELWEQGRATVAVLN